MNKNFDFSTLANQEFVVERVKWGTTTEMNEFMEDAVVNHSDTIFNIFILDSMKLPDYFEPIIIIKYQEKIQRSKK